MKITIIHGQSHKGSTYHMARQLAEMLEGEITEFFLPRDFGSFCTGCMSCIKRGENLCPHYSSLKPITAAMDEADVLILDSPVYVFHVTGPMKAFLDHYAYRWMIHRPEQRMFTKQAVCITTAAGAGMKSALKDMKDSLSFWGVGKVYCCGKAVKADRYADVSDQKKKEIEKDLSKIAQQIRRHQGHVRPNLKTRTLFYVFRMLQRKEIAANDKKYWDEKGWTGSSRPWLQQGKGRI
ncbi:MAG: NAD(P)H-dependent oxidoreductase [Erysipelotrichaceae bacterium]|nr:NAD(P)H-dependent oxidoreductase [Erysipelotrichaceae bacterium]